jgi:uncharacterized protein YodC (DUF2158 family)
MHFASILLLELPHKQLYITLSCNGEYAVKKLLLVPVILITLSSPSFAQNLGDVVYLKSGGPPMTVTEILPRADQSGVDVGLHWFGGSAMLAGTFPASALVVTDPAPNIDKAARDERLRVFPVDVKVTPP